MTEDRTKLPSGWRFTGNPEITGIRGLQRRRAGTDKWSTLRTFYPSANSAIAAAWHIVDAERERAG